MSARPFTDAGYIAVGLGVMGFQQAQVRRRQLQEHVQSAGSCVATKAGEVQDRVGTHGRNLDSKAREARGVAEGTVNQTVSPRAGARLRGHDPGRAGRRAGAGHGLGELPERLVQAIEPVAARVRERFTSAA